MASSSMSPRWKNRLSLSPSKSTAYLTLLVGTGLVWNAARPDLWRSRAKAAPDKARPGASGTWRRASRAGCPPGTAPSAGDRRLRLPPISVVRRDLDELYCPLAPIANRLNPDALVLVVKSAVVLVGAEMALALQQAEALAIGFPKCTRLHGHWVGERTPNPLAGAGPNAHSIVIVGSPGSQIGGLFPVVLRVPEHAGQRRHINPRLRPARKRDGPRSSMSVPALEPFPCGMILRTRGESEGHGSGYAALSRRRGWSQKLVKRGNSSRVGMATSMASPREERPYWPVSAGDLK